MPLGIGFDGRAFAHAYVGRKVGRLIEKLFDGIGMENLIYAIQENRDLLSYVTPEVLYQYKGILSVSQQDMGEFKDSEVYSWIPYDYKAIIETQPSGKKWAISQIKAIKKQLLATS